MPPKCTASSFSIPVAALAAIVAYAPGPAYAADTLPIVALDAGHGGTAAGARGICGVWEKDVALQIAQRCAELLEASELAHAILTRQGDEAVALEARPALANAAHARLLVSIHANASPSPDAQGVETFFLSPHAAGGRLARLLERENEGRALPHAARKSDLANVLSGLAMEATHADSQALAIALQRSMARHLTSRGRGVLQAPLLVLMGARMPAALVEVGFVTHPEECLHLRNSHGQQKIAESIVAGILAFLSR